MREVCNHDSAASAPWRRKSSHRAHSTALIILGLEDVHVPQANGTLSELPQPVGFVRFDNIDFK